jgi:predicted RNase H-like HicB family nuclease
MGLKNMNYRVVLIESDEGFSVSCPALKGCHSQGATRAEALENIRDAIRQWLASESTEKSLFTVTEDEVTV